MGQISKNKKGVCCGFSLLSNAFSLKVPAGFLPSRYQGFKFPEGDTGYYFASELENSIMPKVAEIKGGIDICGEPLNTRLKTLFSFFYISKS